MTRPDDNHYVELERRLAELAANPQVDPGQRQRLAALQQAVNAHRLAQRDQPTSETALNQFHAVMARLHTAVQAQKKELETQLQHYDEREKRLSRLLDQVEVRRKKLAAGATESRRTGGSGRARSEG